MNLTRVIVNESVCVCVFVCVNCVYRVMTLSSSCEFDQSEDGNGLSLVIGKCVLSVANQPGHLVYHSLSEMVVSWLPHVCRQQH